MKDTNAIEKALQIRISSECREIVEDFIADLNKLSNKYGGSMFYDFVKDSSSDAPSFHVQGTHGVAEVLHRMILNCHGGHMLKHKSKELLDKLDII
tara:strand:+ start:1128 stop:1415 length:288 start_codon:yes stop_codon:yes gene_type:complete